MSSKLEDFVASLMEDDCDCDDGVDQSSNGNSLTNVPSGVTEAADDGLPPAVCTYYLNSIKGIGQGCLRVNCKFFHGTEEQLAELRIRCLLDEPLAVGLSAVSAAKRRKPAPEVSSGVKRPIVCLNYLTDTCHRPGCRFLHLPPDIRPLPMTTCEYYLRGNCTRCRCRFFHGTQEVLSSLHSQGVTMYNPNTCAPYDPKLSVEELLSMHTATPTHQPQVIPCLPHLMPVAHSGYPNAPMTAPFASPANTVYVVVNSQTNTVQMHTVTAQPDGSVVIVTPSQMMGPPMYGSVPSVYTQTQGITVNHPGADRAQYYAPNYHIRGHPMPYTFE